MKRLWVISDLQVPYHDQKAVDAITAALEVLREPDDRTLTIGDGEWSYEETTVYEVKSKGLTVQHTDRNTLRKVG